jgi:hypothetical protein
VFARELSPPGGAKSDTNADFPEISKNRRKKTTRVTPNFFRPIDSAHHYLSIFWRKRKKIILPFSRNSVLQRKYLPPLSSKSTVSHERLKTYSVQPAVPYKLVKFQDRCFPGYREKMGVPKIFDPQQSRPPLGDTPESRKIH